MEYCPPLHLGVVAIEKGTFGSLSTKVANFTIVINSLNSTNNNKHLYSFKYSYLILIIWIRRPGEISTKHCEYTNQDEDNNLKTQNDKNLQFQAQSPGAVEHTNWIPAEE